MLLFITCILSDDIPSLTLFNQLSKSFEYLRIKKSTLLLFNNQYTHTYYTWCPDRSVEIHSPRWRWRWRWRMRRRGTKIARLDLSSARERRALRAFGKNLPKPLLRRKRRRRCRRFLLHSRRSYQRRNFQERKMRWTRRMISPRPLFYYWERPRCPPVGSVRRVGSSLLVLFPLEQGMISNERLSRKRSRERRCFARKKRTRLLRFRWNCRPWWRNRLRAFLLLKRSLLSSFRSQRCERNAAPIWESCTTCANCWDVQKRWKECFRRRNGDKRRFNKMKNKKKEKITYLKVIYLHL